jgi:hypothetical protein
MAIRFATSNGNWNDLSTWDGGLSIPSVDDDVIANGFSVTLNQDITVRSLSNGTNVIGMPDSFIPNMTSNNTPSGVGVAIASPNPDNAWRAFKKDFLNFQNAAGTGWNSAFGVSFAIGVNWIGYLFDLPRSIQRYGFTSAASFPSAWVFQGSDDGTNWDTLHSVSGNGSGTYHSPPISNSSSYTYYRISITTQTSNNVGQFYYVDMTESSVSGNGYGVNGTFISTANRNITCTGVGVVRPNLGTATTLSISGTSTTTTIISDVVQYYNLNGGGISGIVAISGSNNTLNITGNFFVTSTPTVFRGFLLQSSSATNTINIIGNISAAPINTQSSSFIQGSGIFNITGNIINNTTSALVGNTIISITTTTNITGNIIGPLLLGRCVNAGRLFLDGNLECSNGVFPLSVNELFLSDSTPISFRFQTLSSNDRFLYTAGVPLGNPATTEVRSGYTYGPDGELTGALKVPPSSAVAVGVPVDNTTGTAIITVTDMGALLSSFKIS